MASNALDRVDMTQPVMLLGSGLTAVDVACSLTQRGFDNVIYMVSRHGLQPLPHRGAQPTPTLVFAPDMLSSFNNVRQTMRSLRTLIKDATPFYDWSDVLAAFRPHIPTVWNLLSHSERSRFLRHVQPYWDIHRHRLSLHVADLIERLGDQQRLIRHAGRVTQIVEHADSLRIVLKPRNSSADINFSVGTLINCTGLCTDPDSADDPLLANLHRHGLCRTDSLGLGIECDDNYAMLNANGKSSGRLYYVGPYLRAKFWEATAVPELRNHVANLAQGLINTCLVPPVSRQGSAQFS